MKEFVRTDAENKKFYSSKMAVKTYSASGQEDVARSGQTGHKRDEVM